MALSADSVKYIFQNAADEVGTAEVIENAQRIAIYLAAQGQATRTNLIKSCFNGHITKSQLNQALDELITASPPIIEVMTVPRSNGQPGSRSRVYKLCRLLAPPTSCRTLRTQRIVLHLVGLNWFRYAENSAKLANWLFPLGRICRWLRLVRQIRSKTKPNTIKHGYWHFAGFAKFASITL